jgi:hypothetical protein
MAVLAAAVDAKAKSLDDDAARVASPSLVKISCAGGYLYASDPGLIGMQFDTVEVNRGTPTDLSTMNGLLLHPGLWVVGFEAHLSPVASLGNNRDVLQNILMQTSQDDPFGGLGYLGWEVTTAIQTVGMPNLFNPPTFGFPAQYLNGSALALVPSDGFRVQVKGLTFVDVPYATLWAAQLGDL